METRPEDVARSTDAAVSVSLLTPTLDGFRSLAGPRRPVAFDIPSEPQNIATTSSPNLFDRSQSPGQDTTSAPSDPTASHKKWARASMDSAALGNGSSPATRRKPSAHHGSPLNPLNPRHASLSIKRRAENAFEHNPMFEEGMDIFQDPMSSGTVLDAKVLELQRRARELGPAPLPPLKSPRSPSQSFSPPTAGPSPKTPQSSRNIRQSLDANVASITREQTRSPTNRNISPVPPTSPLSYRTPPGRPISPSPGRDVPAASPLNLHPVQSIPSNSDSLEKHTKPLPKSGLGQVFSGIRRIGKGKEKEDDGIDAIREHQADERINAIRASPLASDPMLLHRVSTTAEQLGRRYGLINRALAAGEPPPNLLDVIRWRKRVLNSERSRSHLQVHNPSAQTRSPSFDLPPVIDEEPSAVPEFNSQLYNQSEVESLAWVKCLSTLHLGQQDHSASSGKKEMKEWHLTAGVVEAYLKAREEDMNRRRYGMLTDSPSSHGSSLPGPGLDRRPSDSGPPTVGLSPRSSTSASSQARAISGPSSFKFPFSSPKQPADQISVSSSSQKSAELQNLQPSASSSRKVSPASGTTFPSSMEQPGPPNPVTGMAQSHDGTRVVERASQKGLSESRKSSLELGSKSPKGRRHLRNSLPGIIDSSKNSLTQLLSPRSASISMRPTLAPGRSHTSPRLQGGRAIQDPLRLGLATQQSDEGEGSGRSSISDNPLSPVVSTSEDGLHSTKMTAEKVRKRAAVGGRIAGQPPLRELVESEQDRHRTSSLPVHLENPKTLSPDGVDMSTSEDDMSSRHGLAIAKAGRKVAKSWNALTKKEGRSGGLYEDRLAVTGEGPSSRPTGRHQLFRLDTGATERPGTRSDHMLRAGRRQQPRKGPAKTQEEEASRHARKQLQEQREAAAYNQRLSLVQESRQESLAISDSLQAAVTAITDYVTRQTTLGDSLGLILEPPLTPTIFDLLHSPGPSSYSGWKAVEQDLTRRQNHLVGLDEYLASLGVPSWSSSLDDSSALHEIMERIPLLYEQIDQVETEMGNLEREMERVVKLQGTIESELGESEVLYNRAAEKIDTPFPELIRNDELARQLGPENVVQVLPEWVPAWAQTVLFRLSPIVRWLAESILLAFKRKSLFNFLPERLRTTLTQLILACIIASWNITVDIFSALSTGYNHPLTQQGVAYLNPLVAGTKDHPFISGALFASMFYFLLSFFQTKDDRVLPGSFVVHPNSQS